MDAQFRKQLFFSMLRIRMVEFGIADRYSEQEMRCPVHLSIGQEAVAAGACAALGPGDYMMSMHRAHAHYLAKGGDLKAMLAEIYGRADGCSAGMGGSMHLIDLSVNMLGSTPIVGGSIPVAVGTAFGSWMKGEKRATMVFFGEGSTEEGVFAEALNFAALKKLPVIFVCENNQYSVYSSISVRQPPGRSLTEMVRAHGVNASKGDGNDVEGVYRLCLDTVQRALNGDGPTFLEFETYRWLEHCGPGYDNHIGYRTEEEFLEWKKRCPLDNYRAALVRDGVLTEDEISEREESFRREIDEAFAFAKESSFPEEEGYLDRVYVPGDGR
ncbi:MAG: thiamine pyrophosphate-dependent dehydrogenase E1 component subunit alpha [Nitrospinota bacterium]|nr:thiamine pyrophosphate-dependent dehydrogenase E1 component subunit alpha [Nitrospinota bacterium]MDP7371164.1 thiamine pyrophosphate-dependent dehydrogenase E1 component subunit alpha [Nitrospinota bacterium]MDP7503423.1 thiamine pyrophosphate-dependent dehydrogenase E1 component subunit alpha [Nitrospinota bacterium]